ncbi:MAG: hypothetical protein HN981_03645 [Candidatus Pacebacteria bacterium]|jgi:hypothetical protein|nr:hypothetical protein [Candidatus Paceibacterota bacterium]MBT4652291.1 hypothetical protein [Candidatus Paceibacterota bacterium]MBT6756484.1 hypothetical protein [Candidatus Paceibacterota bacterium]MBT6921457.1 hypothetical protein [Candidatus Paceibacterota bacterium]
MKKTVIQLGLATFMLVLLVSPALALEIDVDQYGNINIYEGNVLGKSTEGHSSIQPINSVSNVEAVPVTRQAPSRVIESTDAKDMVVTIHGQGTKVELRDDFSDDSDDDVLKSENLEMRFPAKVRSLTDDQKDHMNKYQEKIKEARQERLKEMVELRERNEGDEKALEIQSRNVKARLNGAEFVLDSETGDVMLTTPYGEEHILTHLPDQALARMEQAGVISEAGFDVENQELEAVVTEDGIQYTTTVSEDKKFLSFFPRSVERKVTLDDATGEVEEDFTSTSWYERMMDRWSY